MSASGLNCPSDTTASCYKYESSTVSSGGCSKTCTYKVADTPSCGANAEITGSGTSCSCKCKSGYHGDPFSGCSLSCTPLANESSDSSTCKTTAYNCDDNCGGTRTCYKSACTGSQVCYNKSCCTPNWPSYQGYDYNNCMTVEDGTASDGCGGTTTKYKSACSGNQTCNGRGSCVNNCTPKSCSSVSVPSNASCDSYCTPQYSDCSTGSSVCTSWSCNYGYHQSGNSCVADCTPKSCSSVSVPSNASCDSYCTPQYSNCSTGSSVCTSWSCDSGYHQSGNSCVKDDDTICYDDCYADCGDAFDNCISDWRYRNLNHMTIDDCYDEEQDCRDYCDDTYDQRNAGCTKVIILEDEKD